MKKEMLINVLQPEECRIAIVEDGLLEELYVERSSQESYVGNIYKGRIVNIEPSIQAVFVDFGIGRNGFLHVSDVDPVYYKHLLSRDALAQMEADEAGDGGRSRGPDRGDRRGGRGRGDRDRRGPRVTAPESSFTVSDERPVASPIGQPESEDEWSFAEGLVDSAPTAARAPEPREERKPTPPPLPRPPRRAPVERPPVVADPADDEDFGAGIIADEAGTVEAPTAEEPPPLPGAEAEESAKPKPRGRSRSRAKKSVEPEGAEGAEVKEPESKTKGKTPRRGRKKSEESAEGAEDQAPTGEEPTDDQPRPMPGAERRTSEDDEPEIRPFFEGGPADDFDVEGSNDRFANGDASEPPTGFDDSEGFEGSEPEDNGGGAELVTADRGDTEAEEDEFAPPPRRDFDDEDGGRGRGRGPGRGRPRQGGPDRGRPRQGGPDRGGRPGGPRERAFTRPPIQEIFKRGQEVLVQVIKEGIGTKGPTLSTFISIAGRYLVLMPSLNRVGVSRKIEDQDARRRLRDIMTGLNPPEGVGFIVRTAAVDRNETELRNDLAYLLRLWQVVARRIKKMPAPVEIYRESDMITRTIRDIFTNDIDTIWVDEPTAFAHASEFLQIVMPRFASRIRYFAESEPLFHRYRIDDEIQKINQKRIDLPQGGSIIIEQTEALVAIDVNSGTFRADNNAEETAFRMNMLAAKEIARQLRLRDLGGVIVNDFIDMRDPDHRRRVENAMRDALKRDRARTKILRISQFGIIEMTRQRIQPSLKKRIFNDCPHCRGTGYVKANETMGIEVMRLLQLAAHRSPAVTLVTLTVHADVAFYLLNRKRREIAALEEKAKMEVHVQGQFGVSPDTLDVRCQDSNGNDVRLYGGPPPRVVRGDGGRDRGGRSHDRRRD